MMRVAGQGVATIIVGIILNMVSFMRSLNAYSIVSNVTALVLTVFFYLLLVVWLYRPMSYRLQPVVHLIILILTFIITTIVSGNLGLLLSICTAFGKDPESNAQGFADFFSFLGLVVVGTAIAVPRTVCARHILQKKCWKHYRDGRYQIVRPDRSNAFLYDSEKEEKILENVCAYKYKFPYLLVCSYDTVVVIHTRQNQTIITDSSDRLETYLHEFFSARHVHQI